MINKRSPQAPRPVATIESDITHVPHDPDSATAWMADGNCRLHPPATFFPSDGVGVDRARKICKDCPVVNTCLEFALDERIDHGVWGGCSERERRRILKRRRVDAAV
jgi:WhiB family transcriptional regulator, redox-sensing transcriptional regulator